jgi:hypothetical protein
MKEGPIVSVAKLREAFASAFGDPSQLIVVMQLEELSKKLDQIIVLLDKITLRLERMEERQKQGLEGIEEAKGPTTGTFASSELPS